MIERITIVSFRTWIKFLSQIIRNSSARLGVSILWILSFLPYSALMALGNFFGFILYYLAVKRRKIAAVNISLCLSDLSPDSRKKILQEHFSAMGKAIFELAICWFWSENRIQALFHLSGAENLRTALKQEKGVILLSAHFTTLEIGGRLLAFEQKVDAVYRKHKSDFLEKFVKSKRAKYTKQTIIKTNIREMLKRLKKNNIVWYAPDQNFTRKNFVLSTFFNQPAPSNPGTARLAKMTGARVIPFVQYRRADGKGYDLELLPELENFPSGDDLQDVNQINRLFEELILKQPSHYYWLHKRFKNLPPEYDDVYKNI